MHHVRSVFVTQGNMLQLLMMLVDCIMYCVPAVLEVPTDLIQLQQEFQLVYHVQQELIVMLRD